MKARYLLLMQIFFGSLTLACSACTYINPSLFWPLGFVAWGTPIFLFIDVLLFIIGLFYNWKLCVLPVFIILICFRPLSHAYALNFFESKSILSPQLSVLNYNVRVFNSFKHLRSDENYSSSLNMYNFLVSSDADILVLQEYYEDKKSPIFNSSKILSKKYPHYHTSKNIKNAFGQRFGLAIFSKYPLSNKGQIDFSSKSNNHALHAEILVKGKKIRIYNIHLQSMHLEQIRDFNPKTNKKLSSELMVSIKKYKKGMLERVKQMEKVLNHIDDASQPVIVGGDFNEPPFSYVYNQWSKKMKNAYKESNTGIGATYNGRIPLLRIDHQFYNSHFECNSTTLYQNVEYSDHFPLLSHYSIVSK